MLKSVTSETSFINLGISLQITIVFQPLRLQCFLSYTSSKGMKRFFIVACQTIIMTISFITYAVQFQHSFTKETIVMGYT
jgi:hypothetical protein